jgi:hypothetical protein
MGNFTKESVSVAHKFSLCGRCKNIKPVTEFYKNKRRYNGLQSICKVCEKKREKSRNFAVDPNLKEKTCGKCQKTKSVDEFYKDKRSHDGLQHNCNVCFLKIRKSRNFPINTNLKEKSCNSCKETKPVAEFSKNKNNPDGFNHQCKFCVSEYNSSFNYSIDPNIKEKICTKCKNVKSVDEFYKRKNHADGLSYICKVCFAEYNNDNKSRRQKRRKERYKKDEEYRIKTCLSSNLRIVLKRNSGSKNGSILSAPYLNCTQEELFERLQSTRDPKWTDEKLHVDHIIPVSLFDHKDKIEIKKCWNLRNLRYLPAAENISKSNTLDIKLIKEYDIEDLLPKTWKEKCLIC